VLDVVGQTGRHAIIYGERVVGKTSLANLLETLLRPFREQQILGPRVQLSGGDNFASAWRRMLESIGRVEVEEHAGFGAESSEQKSNAADLLKGRKFSPDNVRKTLDALSGDFIPILIFDEFDRLQVGPRGEFADMIKNLSDHAVRATVVLVGVGDTVDQLIHEHQSITRALVEIHMERLKAH
jgi:hypothetical protein